jgi:hypothetical protein
MLPGGKTAYLSELRAGDDVLCVGRGGRVVTPGCQIGCMDYTGCHQLLNRVLTAK